MSENEVTLPPQVASYLCLVLQRVTPDPAAAGMHVLALAILARYRGAECYEIDLGKLLKPSWREALADAEVRD